MPKGEPFNFLRAFTELFKDSEVPDSFAVWCGISAVSAALGRRVWIDQGLFSVFPNQYIILVAAAGRSKKSTAIKMTEKLIRSLEPEPNVISQRVTPEAMISNLRVVHTDDPQQMLRESCTGVGIVDEFTTFVNKRSVEMGLDELLTSFWDCKEKFEYRTIARGTEVIRNSCLSILGGTTAELIREKLPKEIIGGGLSSRCIYIYEDKAAPPVPWPKLDRSLLEQVIREIQRISTYSGEVKVTDKVKRFYERHYVDFCNNSPLYENRYLASYADRRFTHLWKVSIALAAMDSGAQIVVTEDHYKAADIILSTAEEKMPDVMALITTNETGDTASEVYKVIKKNGKITRKQLLALFSNRMTAKEFSEVMDTLCQSGRINLLIEGTNIVYKDNYA